jgi:hypothetical protein
VEASQRRARAAMLSSPLERAASAAARITFRSPGGCLPAGRACGPAGVEPWKPRKPAPAFSPLALAHSFFSASSYLRSCMLPRRSCPRARSGRALIFLFVPSRASRLFGVSVSIDCLAWEWDSSDSLSAPKSRIDHGARQGPGRTMLPPVRRRRYTRRASQSH